MAPLGAGSHKFNFILLIMFACLSLHTHYSAGEVGLGLKLHWCSVTINLSFPNRFYSDVINGAFPLFLQVTLSHLTSWDARVTRKLLGESHTSFP